MAVGARDQIDAMLVKKYQAARVDNPIVETSMIDPDKMFTAMNDYAQMHLAMMGIQQKLRATCIKTTAMSIQYRKSRDISKKAAPA